MDDISAAAYNVIFTSLPILFFAVLDRPLRHHKTMLRFPQARTRARRGSCSGLVRLGRKGL